MQMSYVPQHIRPARASRPMLTPNFIQHAPRSGSSIRPSLAPEEILSGDSLSSPSDQQIMPGVIGGELDEGAFHGDDFHGDCACGGDGCELCQVGAWAALCGARERTEVYGGVTSFSSPVNRGGTSSFGFEGGINMGSPLFGGWRGLGLQMGVGGTTANFNGSNFTHDDRSQVFATIGLFRRVDWGLQYGLVFDHLHDDWYANVDLSQARGEVSWMVPEGSELGFMFAASNDDDFADAVLQTGTAIPTTVTERWETNDLYAFFLRHTFCEGGQARLFAGWSGTSDGVLGADALVPLNDEWSLRNSFTYLVPEEGPLDGGNAKEVWNLSMQLVWSPFGRSCGKDYYRPLFNVANNGSMIIER
jgi:hypothetical protein